VKGGDFCRQTCRGQSLPAVAGSRRQKWKMPLRRAAATEFAATTTDADNPAVKLPEPPEIARPSRVPKPTLILMIVILAAMAFVAIYANVQRWRRDKIETVIITPASSPTPTP
jgi:hypothetical protein